IGGYQLYNNVFNNPSKTLAAYCDGFETGNAQEMYDQLDSSAQQKTSVSQLQQALGVLKAAGATNNCTYSNVQQNGSTATATMTFALGIAGNQSGPVHLIKENGAWKLENAANVK